MERMHNCCIFTHGTDVRQLLLQLADPEAGVDTCALLAHDYSRLRVVLLGLVIRQVDHTDHGWIGLSGLKAASLLIAVARLRASISRSSLSLERSECIKWRCFSKFSVCTGHPGRGTGQGPAGTKVLPVARPLRMALSWLFLRECISLRCFAINRRTFPQSGHSPVFLVLVICKSHEILVK